MRIPPALHLVIILLCAGGYAASVAGGLRPPAAPQYQPRPTPLPHFDPQRARDIVAALCALGEHPAGSSGERLVAEAIITRLRQHGYRVTTQSDVPIPGSGSRTRNLRVTLSPASPGRPLLLGAHYDSVRGPGRLGANDNASGVAVLLELARVCARRRLPRPVQLVFFGAEEAWTPYGCFFGSTWYAHHYPPDQLSAMISVDMVGRGDCLYAQYTRHKPEALIASIQACATRLRIPLCVRRGEPRSDHVPFARSGVPALWLQRLPDPDNHLPSDRPGNVSAEALAQVGRLLERLLTAPAADSAPPPSARICRIATQVTTPSGR